MASGLLIIGIIFVSVVVVLFYLVIIHPRFVKKEGGYETQYLNKPIFFDKGFSSYIEKIDPLDDKGEEGKAILTLSTGKPKTVTVSNLRPFNVVEMIAGKSNPIFTEKKYDDDTKELQKELERTTESSDNWQRQYNLLKNNYDKELAKAVAQIVEVAKTPKQDFKSGVKK